MERNYLSRMYIMAIIQRQIPSESIFALVFTKLTDKSNVVIFKEQFQFNQITIVYENKLSICFN